MDHFEATRPMPTYSFGFIITQMQKVSTNITAIQQPRIQVWARKDFHGELNVGSEYPLQINIHILSHVIAYW